MSGADDECRQFALDLALPVQSSFDSYLRLRNEEPVFALEALAHSPSGQVAYLWGPAGTGRSHLLQAVCHALHERREPFVYLPLAELSDQPADVIADIGGSTLVAIDDVHLIAGRGDWEEALFHLFNRLGADAGALVCSADSPPSAAGFALADLASRLASGLVLQLRGLDDEGLREALRYRAARRGLQFNDSVVEYLVRRIGRSMPQVVDAVDRIDRASLREQVRPGISLVKRALGLN